MADGADLSDRADRFVMDRDHVAVVDHLRVFEPLFARTSNLEGHVRTRLEQRQPVVEVVGPKRLHQEVLPRLRVLRCREHRGPAEPRFLQN